jgi:hypothetical protein
MIEEAEFFANMLTENKEEDVEDDFLLEDL